MEETECLNSIQDLSFYYCLSIAEKCLFRMGLFGAVHGWGQPKSPPSSKICPTYPTLMKLMHSYTLPKEDPKTHKSCDTYPLSSAETRIFSPQISNFCYTRKYRYRLHFNEYIIFNSLDFFQSLTGCFNKHDCNFDDVSKIGYSRPS